jgi:hypothetical protein
MADHMYDIVKRKHWAILAAASYMSLIVDETTAVDNWFIYSYPLLCFVGLDLCSTTVASIENGIE